VSGRELIEAIWERDATAWTGGNEAHWLGWLDEPLHVQEQLGDIRRFAESLHDEVDAVVLCGMGGSSLAPEVLRRTFGVDWFHVLDTTHPRAIRALEEKLDLERTFFVSSSKSGSTLETRSHTDYFWEKNGKRGELFAAITDPGSELEHLARERGFRAVFAGEPSIGGRYSALSPFGIVPAVLMGADAGRLLERAQEMREACRSGDGNPGYELGRQFGEGWRLGQDKICIQSTHDDRHFGLWAEQLIAESTGKHGKGLVPAPGESPDGDDRQAAQPALPDAYALGAEFFRWEFAIAVAGAFLEINPFDQPDVQAAKDKTNEVLATGKEPQLDPEGSVEELLAQARYGDYVCVQAFVDPSTDLGPLVDRLRRESGLVVTHGYGPRYQHSTGQLHKGGPNNGLFLQVVDDPGDELPIPGKPFGFRRLIRAQAAGDLETLKERGRRVARVGWEDL
jgi:transaldolase / glucose-6-phosphate isomerase